MDEQPWTKFTYYYIHRGGGEANAGFGEISLSFTNENVKYEVYHNWSDEEDTNDVGIEVTVNGKVTKLKGDINTQIGALQRLDLVENKIKNSFYDE